MKKKRQVLKLKSKAAVFIDWANVYNWKKSLKAEIEPEKLFFYLKSYPQIREINFYFGTDCNQKSKEFLKKVKKIGYRLVTKPVKYIIIGKVDGTVIKRGIYKTSIKKLGSSLFQKNDPAQTTGRD